MLTRNKLRYCCVRYLGSWLCFKSKITPTIFIGLFIALIFLLLPRHNFRQKDNDVMTFRMERYLKYQATEFDRKGPGENGRGVRLSEKDKIKYKDINEKEGFNYGASQLIALDRSLPDFRREE